MNLIHLVWQHALPQLTWIYLYIILTVPAYYRLVALVVLYVVPVQFTYRTNKFGRWILLLVARSKGLKVQRSVTDLPSSTSPAVYAFHPHGRCPLDIYAYLASSEDTNFILMAGSSIGRYLPSIALPMCLYSTTIDATKSDMTRALQRNKQIGLFPGGAREMHECNPGSGIITIIQHDGFLRLARATNSDVVPCFIFGMNDIYDTPLKTLQKSLYLGTKISIPFWFPSLRMRQCDSSNTLVLGKKISPARFKSDEELINFYWSELEKLFEANKGKYPMYANRKLVFEKSDNTAKVQVGLTVGSRSTVSNFRKSVLSKFSTKHGVLSPKLVSMLRFALMMNVIVLLSGIFGYLLTGKWWRYSLGVEYEHLPLGFHTHLCSGILWTIVLIHNFFISTKGWTHRVMGYIGVGSLTALFLSGVSMQLDGVVEAEAKLHVGALSKEALCWISRWALIANTCIQTLSFLLVTESSFFLLTYSIKSARHRRINVHRTTMSMLHLLLADMAVPRVTAFIFRYFLPWLDKSSALSLACLLQLVRHIQLMRARAKYMVPINCIAVVVSVAIAIVTWLSRGEFAVHSSLLGAVGMITLGIVTELDIPL